MLKGIPGLICPQAIADLNAIGQRSTIRCAHSKALQDFLPKNPWENASAREFRAKHFADSSRCPARNRAAPAMPSSGDHLDVGSGTGGIVTTGSSAYTFSFVLAAIYTDQCSPVPVRKDRHGVDLNRQSLPYSDIVSRWLHASRRLEHLENYREVIRENLSCSQPGGVAGIFDSKHFKSALPSAISVVRFLQFVWSLWRLTNPIFHTTRGQSSR